MIGERRTILLIFGLLLAPLRLFGFGSLQQTLKLETFVRQWHSQNRPGPLKSTVLFLPQQQNTNENNLAYTYAPNVCYIQKDTNLRLEGFEAIEKATHFFDDCFQSSESFTSSGKSVEADIDRISTVTPGIVRIDWNVTWVPPTALWLEGMTRIWPGAEPEYISYTKLYQTRSTFSWVGVAKLFQNLILTGKIRIPLACIEGTSTLEFAHSGVVCIKQTEELKYAQNLRRGKLQNRKCAADLQLFLETGRRPPPMDKRNKEEDWDDVVATCLPWSSVPGYNTLDIDPNEEDWTAPAFLGFVAFSFLAFISILAPELLLFGSPNYIVEPQDLNSIY